jgi:phospholipid/cholesterol/gamma-HCH transport system ATP-binding protein
MKTEQSIIEIKELKIQLGGTWVHNNLNLDVEQGEILGIVGTSGSGKTTLLREILMLQRPNSGSIRVFGQELTTATTETLLTVQRRWGVLFQQNALFSSLTVLENAVFPLQERTSLDLKTCKQLAMLKILLVGLPPDAATKYPSELSGGMQKRAALARALVLDPELLFLDEPTAGLDPNSASALDELILTLQSTMGLTVVMITHDLDSLWKITNRVAFLGEGKVLCIDSIAKLADSENKRLQEFFNGPRGRITKKTYE